MIGVGIVEDHPVYLDGLRVAIEDVTDLSVAGTAATVADAQRLVLSVPLQVLLLDLGLPDGSGIDVLSTIRARRLPIATVVLTMNDDAATILSAVRAGARGYLLKGAGRDEILDGIRHAAAGSAVYHAGAAEVVVAALTSSTVDPAAAVGLTDRETEVLRLLAAGLANTAIATRLGVAPKTVRNQVSALLSKLGVADRAAAAAWARSYGIGGSGRIDP